MASSWIRRGGSAGALLLVAGLVTAVAAGTVGNSAVAAPASADPGTFVALAPTRILDTRAGLGAPTAPVPARTSLAFTATGTAGVPAAADVSAVVFNLTVTRPKALGYVSAYPTGQPVPTASSVNFALGETRAHLVVVAPGTSGQVSLFNGAQGAVDLVADVAGYYTAGAPTASGEFGAVKPARVVDTRIGFGAPKAAVKAGAKLAVAVAGHDGVPASGVSAVVLNLTATQPNAAGYLSTSVGSLSNNFQKSSSVNFQKSETVSNLVVAPVNAAGAAVVYAEFGPADSGTVQVVADVSGYYLAGTPTAAGRMAPITAQRLLDTRVGQQPIPAHGTITLPVSGHGGVPQTGISAAVLNFTVAGPAAVGYLTAYPSDVDLPTASTVNFATHTLANQVIVPLSAAGAIKIYNGSSAPENVVVDVSGYVGPVPGPLAWSGRVGLGGNADPESNYEVSCPTTSFCMATQSMSALRYNGSTWSAPQPVATSYYLSAISCTSSTFCMAVNDSTAYVYRSGTWSATNLNDAELLSSVSCTSSTFCVAGGLDSDFVHAWVYNGTTWTSASTGLPANEDEFPKISCVSATFCVGLDQTHGFTFNGTAWTSYAVSVQGSLSCVSTTFCMNVNGDQASIFDGTAWSAPVTLDLDAAGDSADTVSCATTTSCVAITNYGNYLYYDGSTWTGGATIDPADGLRAVSCATTTFCVAVDADAAITGR